MRRIWTLSLMGCLTIVLSLLLAGVLAAQDSSPATPPDNEEQAGKPQVGEKIVERRLENLSKQLNLTDQQKEKVRPVLMHEVERIKEVRSNGSLTQGEARRRIAMVRRNTNQHILALLTPEQKTQWQEMRQDRRGSGEPEGGQGEHGGPANPNAPAAPENPPKP